jgi:hypothetical protein
VKRYTVKAIEFISKREINLVIVTTNEGELDMAFPEEEDREILQRLNIQERGNDEYWKE